MKKGRFSNLELTPSPRARAEPASPHTAAGQAAAGGDTGAFGTAIKDAEHYMARAGEQECAGDHERALRSYSAAVSENPLLLEAWLGQVLMLVELDECHEARLWADKALERFPDEPRLLAAKCLAWLRMGMRSDARRLCDLALSQKGEAVLVWVVRGEIMLRDSVNAGRECFDRALRLAGSRERARLLTRIGDAYLRCAKLAPALDCLQQATRADPKLAWTRYLLGNVQARLGQTPLAKLSYRQAADLAPTDTRYQQAPRQLARGLAGLWLRLRAWFRSA